MQQKSTDSGGPVPCGCDLCIVGAGIAGLNALFVATQYLSPKSQVILIDRNAACGGMWTDTYDYVRLHQPHQMFTVGDLPWEWSRPAEYLASGPEVQAHLAHCLDRLRGKVALTELFGFECVNCEEIITPEGPRVRVLCRSTDGEGPLHRILATRAISATGWDINAVEPLKLSSRRIVSTAPGRLSRDDCDPAAPAVVVGGGKSGMDTVQALLKRTPGREITLVNGAGTVFGDRDLLFPRGARRWWGGRMVLSLSRDVTSRFDGRNSAAVFEYFRRTYTVSGAGVGEQHFFSTLGRDEARGIREGLKRIVSGYLEDVVDTCRAAEIVLRGESRVPLKSGSLVVNCTGHMLRQSKSYEPYLSPRGALLSVNTRSAVYFLSSSAAFFLTHVFFLGNLRRLPIYELDMGSLHAKDRKLFFLTCLTHSFHNMMVIMQHTPLQVFSRCGLDMNRWYPVPRRVVALIQLKLNLRRYLAHCRASLDRVRREHGIRCGPLGLTDLDTGAVPIRNFTQNTDS